MNRHFDLEENELWNTLLDRLDTLQTNVCQYCLNIQKEMHGAKIRFHDQSSESTKHDKKGQMKSLKTKLQNHMLDKSVDHYLDMNASIVTRLMKVKSNIENSFFNDREMKIDSSSVDVESFVDNKCHMLTGSLEHRKDYLENLKVTWSMPKLYEEADKSLPSEV